MRPSTIDAATLAASLLFAALVAMFFVGAWHFRPISLAYNVPIAAPFAAMFGDRLVTRPIGKRGVMLDLGVVGLALLRVFAPPLPWASGHTLLTAYATLTARRWPLRALAGLVLLEVAYMKLFVTGGWASMVSGLLVGGGAAALHHRLRPPSGTASAA